MKVRIAVLLFMIFGLAACSQYSCPTYSKAEKKEVKQQENI